MSVTFTTVLRQAPGSNAVGIEVPEGSMAQLGPAKRYPVVVTIGDFSYRNSVSWYHGAFMIGLSAENRAAAGGLTGGDEVVVTLEIDDAPRIVEIPVELRSALSAAGALQGFEALSASKQKALIAPWEAAKTATTRDKNLATAVAAAS
ncbi:MAG: DUF1905 domain-containing protein [Salinibacterium sp.]|nr:DUF1905 domain-containing protein [Salinibacterium sp.]